MPIKGQGTGLVVTREGYVRIKRRGLYREWYEHRRVMYEACLVFCYYPTNGNLPLVPDPPGPFTVEHLDHRKGHNCLQNLLLLDKRIHDAISLEHANNVKELRGSVYDGGGYVADPEAPDWMRGDGGQEEWEDGRE